ncbi:MAG: pitrilysin family protein [Oscillospiraceae bacterium]|nr:pitrilysin family protein [Oscillospiraceae bacterium]
MNRELISKNVHLTVLPNDKFKRNRITVAFVMPNERDKATMYALLPGMLERAYEDYPEMRLFSKKLSKMYSATLSVNSSVVGCNRIVRFTIQGIKNEYCLDKNEDLLKEMCKVLLGVIFRPCLVDGAFAEEWLEIEKYKLREEIEGEINDKRSYCIKNARRKFYGDSLNGVERLGYISEIDGITPKALYDCYKNMIDNAVTEIFITANNPDTSVEMIKNHFSKDRECFASIIPVSNMPCKESAECFTEHIDTVQGKVCLLYTTKRVLTERERYKMLVASALFGGVPSSRLFKNVREKQSLCYYCRAGFNGFSQSMSVDSGVEHCNAQRTVEAVQRELENLINGPISDEEINEIKLAIKNSLNSNYDTLYGLEAWYLNESLRDTFVSPEYAIEQVEKVTVEDIKDVLSLLNLNVIYTITK